MKSAGTIQVPQNSDCAFCKYLSGQRPYIIVSRDRLSATFVTREQRGVAHLLVLPIAHRETILQLTDEEASSVILRVRAAASAIEKAYKSSGISVWQNNGIAADQTIAHVHFHVAGTLGGGGTDRGDVPEISLSDAQEIAGRIGKFT